VEIIQTVVLEQGNNEVQNRRQLIFQLIIGAVDMRIILGKATRTGQTMNNTGLFIAVYGAELKNTQWKFTVGTTTGIENEVVHRTVHGLEVVVLPRLGLIALFVIFSIDMHRWEHTVFVETKVAGTLKEVLLGDVRSVHERVAGLDVTTT